MGGRRRDFPLPGAFGIIAHMRLSKKSEYALRALVCMARAPSAKHTIAGLSDAEGIPPKFLEQILLQLRQDGFLTSRRGAGGGYTLNRPAARISVFDVLASIEGRKGLVSSETTNPGASSVRAFLADLENEIGKLLASRSIEDLVRIEQHAAGGQFEI